MIEKILPNEETQYYNEFNDKINKLRENLLFKQKESIARQQESLKALQWKDLRRRDLEKNM